MKKKFMFTCVSMAVIGSLVGCASRTVTTLGPVQIAGQVQVFDAPQEVSFDFGWDKVGFTVGYFGCEIGSLFGPCEKLIGINSATGDPEKVFSKVPTIGGDN